MSSKSDYMSEASHIPVLFHLKFRDRDRDDTSFLFLDSNPKI